MPASRSSCQKFSVDKVKPVKTKKPTINLEAAVNNRLNNADERVGSKTQSVLHCSDGKSDVIDKVDFHPFIASVHYAYAEHRPLVLSPDMIWTVILQGLAHHTNNNAEALRSRLVSRAGKQKLIVVNTDIHPNSPESDWDGLIQKFADELNQHTILDTQALVCDFSTTGKVERLVSQICILDVFKPYFEYIVYTVCGIPEILLEGVPEDWQKLRDKIELLDAFDLGWWTPHLREVVDEFVSASNGRVNLTFWKNIYKRRDLYGHSVINGWIIKLIPYIKSGITGNIDIRNDFQVVSLNKPDQEAFLNERRPAGISTACLPSGLSQTPFKVIDDQGNQTAMEMIGGFGGVSQLADTGALRAKLIWAVRKGEPASWDFEIPASILVTPAVSSNEHQSLFYEMLAPVRGPQWMPAEVFSFYEHFDGLALEAKWRIFNLKELTVIQELVPEEDFVQDDTSIQVLGRPYLRFFERNDGSFAAIHLDPYGDEKEKMLSPQHHIYEVDAAQNCTLVAHSLSEFVKMLIAEI